VRAFRADHVWTPGGGLPDHTVVCADDGQILAVRPAQAGDGPAHRGMLAPGWINAHAHLELSHLRGRVPGGEGFLPWVRQLFGVGAPPADARQIALEGARRAARTGTAYWIDVSNAGDTAPLLREAGLHGVVHHEVLGFDLPTVPEVVAQLGRRTEHGIVVRSSPHAVFSTAPEVITACVHDVPSPPPATLHVGEAEAEGRFLRDGTGPHADLLDHLGRRWRGWTPPGTDVVTYLDGLGVLGPQLLLVHGVHVTPANLGRLAATRTTLVCCPRSNLHIGGQLPPMAQVVASGVPLALGTDSLASNDSLDVLQEAVVLAEAVPDVPHAVWLTALTHGGADAVGATGYGRLTPGTRPGVVWMKGMAQGLHFGQLEGVEVLVPPGGFP